METRNRLTEQEEVDKVISLLTPRHRRYPKSKIELKMKSKRSNYFKWIAFGGIAAMIAVIVTFAVNPPAQAAEAPLSAPELAAKVLQEVNEAQKCRVEFTLRAVRSDDEEVYTADIAGEPMNGTMYLTSVPGDEQLRVEWDDPEKTVIIFDGKYYVKLENGTEVKRFPTTFHSEKFKALLNLESVNKEFKSSKKFVFTEDGDNVIVTSNRGVEGHGILKLKAIFSKSECKLKSINMVAEKDGEETELLSTRSIQYL